MKRGEHDSVHVRSESKRCATAMNAAPHALLSVSSLLQASDGDARMPSVFVLGGGDGLEPEGFDQGTQVVGGQLGEGVGVASSSRGSWQQRKPVS